MIIKQYPLTISIQYPLNRIHPWVDRIAFFDIETTGFSADTSYLYLIGCIYYKDNSYHLIQWFSEGIQEETLVLTSFFEFLKSYDVLIHFNGNGFDLPYILRKCKRLHLDDTFEQITSIDLYKCIKPYKKLFGLKNYKQKTVEEFLNIARKDTYSGGDLIEVYQNYLGKRQYEKLKQNSTNLVSEGLLAQLLLHNEDDLKGLLSICDILSYTDIFQMPLEINQITKEDDFLLLQCHLTEPVPISIEHNFSEVLFSMEQKQFTMKVKTYHGELRYFYPNYKDYYYLPKEDQAIHKSVASFVDKEFRTKAKASTCYTKKIGRFLPLYESTLSPSFKKDYKDKFAYLELTEDLFNNKETLHSYTTELLRYFFLS